MGGRVLSRSAPAPDPTPLLAELKRFSHALQEAVRGERVAELIADLLMRLLAPQAVAVALESPEGARSFVAAACASRGAIQPAGDDPLLALARRAGGPLRLEDPAAALRAAGLTPRQPVPASWLGMPLSVGGGGAGGRTIGAVGLWGSRRGQFGADAEALLAAVAAQAAMALENARLFGQLSIAKREWEQTVDVISPAICIVDAEGNVRRANRAFATLVKTPVTAITARGWSALLPAEWRESIERALAHPGEEGRSELRSEGRIMSVLALPLSGEDERSAVLLLEDHTETRRLQEQLIQSEKMSAIGQLIAGVAHDLNNPLASVIGFADFLSESQKTPANLVEPLRVIQQEAERASTIVHNLLSFARRQEQQRGRVAIGPILERTLVLLHNQLTGLKVESVLAVEPDLPEIEANPIQLQQVFLNLINNAAQALAATGTGGSVFIRARPWLGGIAVDVVDDGPGIPEALHARVFEPFFTTKRDGEGTGLGLSICHGIVTEHGGHITLKSSAGQGATFTVELPSAAGPKAADSAGVATAPTTTCRVLVVDDEPHILHYMRAALEAWGHRVDVTQDASEALRRTLTGTYDLIITDLRMPGLGGRELYERLEQEAPHLARRVVFSTGDTVRGDAMAFLERSGRPFLRKPFKLAELREVLAAFLTAR